MVCPSTCQGDVRDGTGHVWPQPWPLEWLEQVVEIACVVLWFAGANGQKMIVGDVSFADSQWHHLV